MVLSKEWENLKKGKSKSSMDHEDVRRTILEVEDHHIDIYKNDKGCNSLL